MNVSEYIFDFFSKKEINTAFIITGGQAMFLNDAIAKSKKYNMIFNHHEQACTMAADAYGRIKNKPAIALVTAGPASVNALNGVVGGYIDSAPMIVISGQSALSCVEYQEQTQIRQYGVQGINIKPMVEKYVKYFITIDSPSKIHFYLEKAYMEATTGRMGPVWVDVPLDMQRAEVPADDFCLLDSVHPEVNHNLLLKSVAFILDKLKHSSRPILLVGQGVRLAGAANTFLEFVEKFQIPVITSRLGIDLIHSDCKFYVGRPGNYGERAANFALQNSDLILAVGCRMATALVGHDAAGFAPDAFKIMVDIDQKELDKPGVEIHYKAHFDCKDFLSAMFETSSSNLPDYSKWLARCSFWKKNYPVVLKSYKDEKPVNSYYFTDRLSFFAKENHTVLVDTGSCFHVAAQTWKVKKGQTFLTTGGLSSMGYWVACIGACMTTDSSSGSVICITGDGSFQMNIQELATIKHNNLPVKIFIFNNNGYLLIRHTQTNFFNGNLVGESPTTGLWCPDALKIADSYGIKGIRINTVDEVDEKIQETLSFSGPIICEVMTPENQLLIPRISSEKLPNGTLVSRAYDDMFPYLPKEEYMKNKKVTIE